MIKLKKPPGIVVRYNWKLTDIKRNAAILSNKIKYQEKNSFRIGFKNPPPYTSPTLIFVTTSLNKIGLTAEGVSFSSSDDPKLKPMELKEGRKDDENGAIQLFTAPLKPVGSACSFIFTVHLIGIVENYRVTPIDGLLSQQLLSSIQAGTDLKLIAKDESSFRVHKWMLAARSPVFAALLNQQQIESNYLMDCDTLGEITQFIRFIYTGEFEESVSGKLSRLAVEYGIKSLEKIDKVAAQDNSEDKMATLAFNFLPGNEPLCNVEFSKPEDLEIVENDGSIYKLFKIKWKVDHWTKENQGDKKTSIAASGAFVYEDKKLFRAELKMWKIPQSANLLKFKLRFLSYGHEKMSCITEQVTYSIRQDDSSNTTEQLQLIEGPTHDKKLLQLFMIRSTDLNSPFNLPLLITFDVKLRSTVPNYINKPVDTTWSEQIWAAAINRTMTDVEFVVGGMIFGAHRSLLSARSPVFAAMFASRMKEAETGQVRIEDVDPTTFQQFLKFLYTGTFESSSMDRELFIVADKYRVETLMEMCRPATSTIDEDDIFKTFLFC